MTDETPASRLGDDPGEPARNLLTAEEIRAAAQAFSHPWNENSRIIGTHLSGLTGLRRAGVSLVRVPAGRESFCYHVHHREEEWVYVLAGTGTADIGGEEHPIGPGDFLAFHAGGAAHQIRNTGGQDLVYLMGGEHCDHEIVDFPALGRRMVRVGDEVESYDRADARPFGSEARSTRRKDRS